MSWSPSMLLRAFAAYRGYRSRVDAGSAEPWDTFLAEHPDLASVLQSMRDGELADPEDPPPPVQPERAALGNVDRFELLDVLGRGGYGVVYLARDCRNGLQVALKLLNLAFADEFRRKRFEREATTLRTLSHTGICSIIDFSLAMPQPWIAMRYVPGATLDKLLATHRTPNAAQIIERVQLVEMVARALAHAHASRFLHRDIKPSNIMVTPEGNPVLLDFGLVRATEDDDAMTLTGMALGSPPYMAPERHALAPDDVRADVWSLGVVLYECLAGQRPFELRPGETWTEVVRGGPARSVRRRHASVAAALSDIVDKALQVDPRDRYQSCSEFADDLGRWLRREPVHARRAGLALRTLRWSQRQPLAAGLIASLLVALLGIGVLAWHARDVAAAESRSQQELRVSSAQRAFAAAVSEASFGRWQPAAANYQLAADLGHDPIAIALRRIELWDATFETARAQHALEGLVGRSDLAEHAPMVALLANDPTRRGDRELDEGWRQTLAELVGARSLPGAAHHFAQALLAKTLPQARAHLDAAIAIDPRHRPSNEMRWPVVLLVQGPQAALDEARRFSAMYPEDPLAALMQSLSLHLLGRVAEADALLAKPAMPPSVRKFRDFLTDFRNRLRAVVRLMMEATVHGYFGASKDVGELQIAGLQALFADLKIDELDEHVFTLRLPPAAKPLLSQCLAASAVMNVGGSRRPLDNLLANLPLELYYLFRAEHSRRAGDHEQALVDLRVGTGHDLFGLEVESAVFRVGVAAACAFDLRDQPERCSVMNAEVSHAIRRALSVSPALDALSLRYFAARAIDCGAALLAQECLSRLLRSVPDDADAAVFVARQLQRAGFAGSAHDLADRIRTRWPDHPLPPTLDPTKR